MIQHFLSVRFKYTFYTCQLKYLKAIGKELMSENHSENKYYYCAFVNRYTISPNYIPIVQYNAIFIRIYWLIL